MNKKYAFEQRLRNKSLYHRYGVTKDKIRDILEWNPPPSISPNDGTLEAYYNDHGYEHSLRILEHLSRLASGIKLNQTEVFLLLCAAFLHDIGMFWGKEKREAPSVTRKMHHIRSAEYVTQNPNGFLDFSSFETEFVRELCLSHRSTFLIIDIPEIRPLHEVDVRVRLICKLLRIADASDVDNRRAPQSIFDMYREFIPTTSKEHWKRNFPISAVRYNLNEEAIVIHLSLSNQASIRIEQIDMAQKIRKELQYELRSINFSIDRNKRLSKVVFVDFRTENQIDVPSSEEILRYPYEELSPIGRNILRMLSICGCIIDDDKDLVKFCSLSRSEAINPFTRLCRSGYAVIKDVNGRPAFLSREHAILNILLNEDGASLDDIVNKTGLPLDTVYFTCQELISKDLLFKKNNTLSIKKFEDINSVLVDWNGVLVDDSAFDDALCEIIVDQAVKNGTFKSKYEAMIQLRTILDELEQKDDYRWYDYSYLATTFKIEEATLKHAHHKLASNLKILPDAKKLLNYIADNYDLYLVTNCAMPSLKLRMEAIKLDESVFTDIVTSDQTKFVRDKKKHIRTILNTRSVSPKRSFVIGNDFVKDIVAAKALGCRTIWVKNQVDQQSYWGTPSIEAKWSAATSMLEFHKSIADFIVNSLSPIFKIL